MPVVPPVTMTTSPLKEGEPKPSASKRVFAAAADSRVAVALRGRVAGRSAGGESCGRQQAFGCGCLLSMSQGCVWQLVGTLAGFGRSHHCGGGVIIRLFVARSHAQNNDDPGKIGELASVLQCR